MSQQETNELLATRALLKEVLGKLWKANERLRKSRARIRKLQQLIK